MAITITDITRSNITSKLDTYNYTVTTASMYVVDVSLDEIPPSSVSIEIRQNGVTKAVTTIPTPPNESNVKLRVVMNCAVNDVLTVVLASLIVADTNINCIKALINIHPGSN